ncbi:MAG: 1-acyl-sn-glycerol-3-phosphate acyltransferase [Planctomycetes bacterium]|nr:1-acyl-sn-glycerol-3-phosphate acyltransferase [Planctomycetota bacterium]
MTVRRPNAFWWNISKFAVWAFSKVWFRLRVEGREHWPTDGPVIVVANHSSYLDPPMVGISSPRWLLFLAQAGLARFGPARWWMARVGVTLIDRDAPSKEALRLLSDSLRAGHPVGIFPEGTRSADGAVGPFRSGAEFLVRRSRAPVLPVGIDGSHRAMPRTAWLPRPRKIVVRFGAPWTSEQVLAPGGIEALRREVARLANAPLADVPSPERGEAPSATEAEGRSPESAGSAAARSHSSAVGASESRRRQSS